jgi:hypothetical protein
MLTEAATTTHRTRVTFLVGIESYENTGKGSVNTPNLRRQKAVQAVRLPGHIFDQAREDSLEVIKVIKTADRECQR